MDSISQLNSALSGRYLIEREIGAGGMATVFLARDLRHDRQVAVKVLNPELGAVLGVERFLTEIKVMARLQHPNILPLFDSGEAGGLLFYVMPFVQGESLRERLDRETQLPIDEAVRIAVGVAGALEYAHGRGVIHRDLKPANILLQADQPMIADFGIALAVSIAGGTRITKSGISLGTPQYMSPEQATGDRGIDARTDIFSLAAVTYEMLTGEPPHSGANAQAIIAKLMTEEVRPIALLRHTVPAHVDEAVLHALQKLPADRFMSARDLAEGLEGRATSSVGRSGQADTPTAYAARQPAVARRTGRRKFLRRASFALFCVALATGAGLLLLLRPARDNPATTARFVLNFEPDEWLADGVGTPLAISRDGRLIAYAAIRGGGPARLYVRPINELRARELSGTEGAFAPEFSPDGKWIAFVTGTQLKKVPTGGGTPITISRPGTGSVQGLSWSTQDVIVVGAVRGALSAVRASGGAVDTTLRWPVVTGSISQRWPLVLRDGNTVVFVEFSGALATAQLAVGSLRDHTARPLGLYGTAPLGVVEGQLIYTGANGALMAVPFDERRARVTDSTPTQVADRVSVEPTSAAAIAAMSAGGDLIYQYGAALTQLVISNEQGHTDPLLAELREFGFPRFSPDGKRIAVSVNNGSDTDIWIYDRADKTLAKLTSGEGVSNERPEWTPDGRRILYRSNREGAAAVWWQAADHSGAPTLLLRVPGNIVTEAVVSPDGQHLLARTAGSMQSQNHSLWLRHLSGDTIVRSFLGGESIKWGARFSPDGRWIAYASDESGVREVYVTPFPGPGQRLQVSTGGGDEPVWSRDGRRLYFARDRDLFVASVTPGPKFEITGRRSLFHGPFVFVFPHANYDVSPDGKEFLLLETNVDAQALVVLGWRAELKALLAARAKR